MVGIDLSGPSNTGDTAIACCERRARDLALRECLLGAGDAAVHETVASLSRGAPSLVIGIDAPLSYNAGGGDRPADSDLRRRLVKAGLHPGSVMCPTMTGMAYLTLRGIAVARLVAAIREPRPRIVEIHPGGVMVLRGAPANLVRTFKRRPASRRRLLIWLEENGLLGASRIAGASDHQVAACAVALAAWQWSLGRPAWITPADPPHHPFDFAC